MANQQQQEYCTDTECFTGSKLHTGRIRECIYNEMLVSRKYNNEIVVSGDPRGEGNAALFFMTFWFLMALVFYFLRPKTRVPPSDKSGDQAVRFLLKEHCYSNGLNLQVSDYILLWIFTYFDTGTKLWATCATCATCNVLMSTTQPQYRTWSLMFILLDTQTR